MKSVQLITFSLLLLTSNAFAQKNLILGNWNYIDNDGIYYEITISEHYIYIYSDSGDVERRRIKLTKKSLSFGKELWIFKKNEYETIEILSNKNGMLKLYQLVDFGNELIDFYQWSHAKYHNGNGTVAYWRDATERKESLLTKLKNNAQR